MRKRNILIVLSYYHPYVSGVSEYARLLAEGLAKKYDITVLTGQHDPALPDRELLNECTVERGAVLARIHKGYLSFDLARRYRKLVSRADLVNFHLPMLDAAWLCSFTPAGMPVVSTYQCDVQAVGGAADRIAVASVNFASCRALSRSRRIFVLSEDYARGSKILAPFEDRWVEGYAPTKCSSGVDTETINDTDEFRVGFLGRFVAEKGLDVLLDAAFQVLPSVPSLKLVLGGEYRNVAGGSVYKRLRPLIDRMGSRVELLGRVGESALSTFYRSLDVFVLPSVNSYEAFGMVQVEAMLRGTPVIASDLRGVRIPVQLTGNGYLVPPGDPSALADAIRKVATAQKFRRDEVANRTSAQFSSQKFIERYSRVIDSLVN